MKLLLYCTKAKPYLYKTEDTTYPAYPIGYHTDKYLKVKLSNTNELANLNGKIVAECDFEVDTIAMQKGAEDRIYGNNGFMGYGVIKKNGFFNWYDENKACLSEKELFKYLEGFEKPYLMSTNYKCKTGYAIHIKNLHIFDEPKELNSYYNQRQVDWIEETELYRLKNGITTAPQNMYYAYKYSYSKSKLEKYILISIRPEWLCKILNGEKTIEVRKKVLKEMWDNE